MIDLDAMTYIVFAANLLKKTRQANIDTQYRVEDLDVRRSTALVVVKRFGLTLSALGVER